MEFQKILKKHIEDSYSLREQGTRFEKIIQLYLMTDKKYSDMLETVWMWEEFPYRKEFGKGNDIGIDLVAKTYDNEYWAIQCKAYAEERQIAKKDVDTFLSTSSKTFEIETGEKINFSYRLFVSTTNNWSNTAEETLKNQTPPVARLNLSELENAPVNWFQIENGLFGEKARVHEKKQIRNHQKEALESVNEYFKTSDRGKLIMACGTGKTFTSLKIAENETNKRGLILFLVPSIALLGQTLREWVNDSEEKLNAICICSDPKISKKTSKEEDSNIVNTIDLAMPASTDVESILNQFRNIKKHDGLKVVFSTYQSIEIISKAQKKYLEEDNEFGVFDLIICDEAHRTTGAFEKDKESSFTKVHDNVFIEAKKRLYMTATPRIYSETSKSKANEKDIILCSMDDEVVFGDEIYRIGFGRAVEEGLLSDYKVLILTVSEKDIPSALQKSFAQDGKEFNSDDYSKLIGCVNGLSKQILGDEGTVRVEDDVPMKRAVAFCSTIKNSEEVTGLFNKSTDYYVRTLNANAQSKMVEVNSKHVDGTMNTPQRDELLNWLRATPENPKETRILTNVKCLSEGVDVPSLDAILFVSAKNSEIDVVQSVGRVMRKAPNKKYGYIIIPIMIPSDVKPEEALNDNKKYAVVWTVLNALRAHDDRFNATVNQMEFNKKKPKSIIVGRVDASGRATIEQFSDNSIGEQFSISFSDLQSHIYAKLVEKVGERRYWENWAKDVAKIAETQISKIKNLIETNKKHRKTFDNFIKKLQENINPEIDEKQAIEMLSQHIITKPVFEALFENYSFVEKNAISKSMQKMLALLQDENFEAENKALEEFYRTIKIKVEKIDNAEAKQKIIVELYDKFFKTAFPELVKTLGIVYTPVEVVDFIIHSVEDILKKEFGRNLTDEKVNILDPFTGTGTFITRLLQSGLIKDKDLDRKYKYEIFANEIVLLAYYIATVNIENVYHDLNSKKSYEAFEGIALTDTFQTGEEHIENIQIEGTIEVLEENIKRVNKIKNTPLTVIIGNPPYSVGQKSENDNAKNQSYPVLEKNIADTYAKLTTGKLKSDLYNSYIKAFRWSSNKLDENGGIIGFITDSGWIDKKSFEGFRKTIESEFSSIYIFDLKGAIKGKIGENAKEEGENIFPIMTGVAITILVKNPLNKNKKCEIYYQDIGKKLKKSEKLEIIKNSTIVKLNMKKIIPNKEGDWINKRSENIDKHIPLIDKNKNRKNTFFNFTSLGIATNRDKWAYNFSKKELEKNMKTSISFYNKEIEKFNKKGKYDIKEIEVNKKQISWTDTLKNSLKNNKIITYSEKNIIVSTYRPFTKLNLYYDKNWIHRLYQQPKIFPEKSMTKNKIIITHGNGSRREFIPFICGGIVDLNLFDGGANCYPMYYYEEQNNLNIMLFGETQKYERKDGISDFILNEAKIKYGTQKIEKEDIFYYVYGFLHNQEYRDKYSSDLKKVIPRLPLVDKYSDFIAYSEAGRKLADLHLNYENIPSIPEVRVNGVEKNNFKVEKMRFLSKIDKSKIIFNSAITIENIPTKAYEYVVNGKSAIEWILERYEIKIDKDTGIINDANDWAEEVGNPRYILDLLLSVISLSVQSVGIIENLPKVEV